MKRRKPNPLKGAIFMSGRTQIEVAFKAGLSSGRVSSIACGYLKPTAGDKYKLSQELGIPVEELFPVSEDKGIGKGFSQTLRILKEKESTKS